MMKTWKSIDAYFFDRGSPITLAMFRILIGSCSVIALALLAASYSYWYGPKSYNPSWTAQMFMPPRVFHSDSNFPSLPRIGLLRNGDSPAVMWGMLATTFVAAILTTLGLWTRVSAIILALGVVSIHHRMSIILNGGDTIMRVSVIYLAISPCGAACSLDRLIAVAKGRAPVTPEPISLWMQRIITWNVALVYFTTLWMKTWGSHWKDFTATWYTSRLEEFARFPVPQFMKEAPVVQISSLGTLVVEFALATLVFWRPARKWVLLAGLAMHGFIEYSMNIPMFAFLMCSWYIAFYEGEEIAGWAKRLGNRFAAFKIQLTLPPEANDKIRNALTALDGFGMLTLENGSQWAAFKADGTEVAISKIWTRLPATWPWYLPWYWLFGRKWQSWFTRRTA